MAGANYPELYDHLRGLIGRLGKELPGPMSGFSQLHKQALADGVLDAKTKELMALAISICVPCDGCIAFHMSGALRRCDPTGGPRDDRRRGPHGRRSRGRVWGPGAGSAGAVSTPGRRLIRFRRGEVQRPQAIAADRFLRQPRDNRDSFDRTLHAFDMRPLLGGTRRQQRIVGSRGSQRRVDDPCPGFDAGSPKIGLQVPRPPGPGSFPGA